MGPRSPTEGTMPAKMDTRSYLVGYQNSDSGSQNEVEASTRAELPSFLRFFQLLDCLVVRQ
jgi:hypothetical protein